MINLPKDIWERILFEGEASYPYECCGFILGNIVDNGDIRDAIGIIAVNNSRLGDDKKRRFVIDATDFLKAEREAANKGLDIISIYHSHPDHPSEPSQYDLDNALPFYSYLIVEVNKGNAGLLRSWILENDRTHFTEELVIKMEN
jgi:proteasome lid subunit RPN8/RPN11